MHVPAFTKPGQDAMCVAVRERGTGAAGATRLRLSLVSCVVLCRQLLLNVSSSPVQDLQAAVQLVGPLRAILPDDWDHPTRI